MEALLEPDFIAPVEDQEGDDDESADQNLEPRIPSDGSDFIDLYRNTLE